MSIFPRYTPAKAANAAKIEPTLASLAALALTQDTETINQIQAKIPEWQTDFCNACGDFNNWRGCCPQSVDDCLLSKVLDCGGDIEKLKEVALGQGISANDIIRTLKESGEPVQIVIDNPLWLFCLAEYLVAGEKTQKRSLIKKPSQHGSSRTETDGRSFDESCSEH